MWQADLVKDELAAHGYESKLVLIKSEGDTDLKTPLYEMGVQGIFTRALDIALLEGRIDVAVHSMKDVPTQLPAGIVQAAVLKRGNHKDLFVLHPGVAPNEEDMEWKFFYDSLIAVEDVFPGNDASAYSIATSSIRRKAQWLHRYPRHVVENIRGNVNTRLKKLEISQWTGAIFAAAGLERIGRRPGSAIELDWMLPAPAQGAITIACRAGDETNLKAAALLDHSETAVCTKIERDFLRQLLGGCSTPISAYAIADKNEIWFRGNILSLDGKEKIEIERYISKDKLAGAGGRIAIELLANGGQEIADKIRNES
jgi:hydroxymethylbilane synthase